MASNSRNLSTPRMTADRAEKLVKGSTRAGKDRPAKKKDASSVTEVAAMARRKKQNAGIKDGTIRLGRSGKSYNVYDAATGTWKRGVVKTGSTAKKGQSGSEGGTPIPTAIRRSSIETGTTNFPPTYSQSLPRGSKLPRTFIRDRRKTK